MKSPNLFSVKVNADIVPDDIKDFANFGASVISIISNFNIEEYEYIIQDIVNLINSNKYKAVTKEYQKNIGLFS